MSEVMEKQMTKVNIGVKIEHQHSEWKKQNCNWPHVMFFEDYMEYKNITVLCQSSLNITALWVKLISKTTFLFFRG